MWALPAPALWLPERGALGCLLTCSYLEGSHWDPTLAWGVRVKEEREQERVTGPPCLLAAAPTPSMPLTALPLSSPSVPVPRRAEAPTFPSEPACECRSPISSRPCAPAPPRCLELFRSWGAGGAPSAEPATSWGLLGGRGMVWRSQAVFSTTLGNDPSLRPPPPTTGHVTRRQTHKTQQQKQTSPFRISCALIFFRA